MVSVGDKIRVGNTKGIITDIAENFDNRYLIVYKSKGKTYTLLEGDTDFKVIK